MKKIKSKNNHILKKLLVKFVRKLGYEIINQNNLTIPSNNKKITKNLSTINKRITNIPLGFVDIKKKINSVAVILRTFTNENKLLSQNKKRIFEKSKTAYSIKALKSICENIISSQKEFKNIIFFLKIIDDNSSKKFLKQMFSICKKSKINFQIENLNIDKFKDKMNFKNNDRMIAHNCHIYQSKEFALSNNYDLFYFLEDDYVHEQKSLIEMIYTYQKLTNQISENVILCPADYPYLYQKFEPSNIVIGHEKHWRQISETLCTYMISKKNLIKYLSYYKQMYLNNHDPYEKPLHNLYKKTYCFSPIPSLAMHVANINSVYGLPPLIDWEKLWNKF